jgi:hypothetical protein
MTYLLTQANRRDSLSQEENSMSMAADRQFDLDLVVTPFGDHGLLMATSEQMPNLRVTGTDDANLWDCLQPVITSLIEAKGEKVQQISVDRSRGPRTIRVHVQATSGQ